MEEEIYIAPDGLEYTESKLREEYGERFDEFVSQGLFRSIRKRPWFS